MPVTCGNLAPHPGIEPGAPAVEVGNPNHWTTREFPELKFNQPQVASSSRHAPITPPLAPPPKQIVLEKIS